MTTTPTGTDSAKLAADLTEMVTRSRRVLAVIIFTQGAVLLGAVVAIVLLSFALVKAEHRIALDEQTTATAFCDTQYTIGTAPLPAASASKLGTEFVEASRKAFIVLGCPGRLGPPSKDLIELGHKYDIPIRY
jgi:hypothetical protein